MTFPNLSELKDGESAHYTFNLPPPAVGYYDLGGIQLRVIKRPSFVQRWFVRWCFGWKWVDKR